MSERLIANVLSRARLTMTSEAVLSRLRNEFGVAAAVLIPTLDDKNGFVIDVDGTQIAVVFENHAMPVAELEVLHGNKRDSEGPLLHHRTHAMLSPLNMPEDHAGKMRATLRLVQTIASVAAEPGTSAVLWSFSQTLVPVEQFRQLTAQWTASSDDFPLFLLARIATYKDGTKGGVDRYGMFGVGFQPFIGRDIEFPPEPRPLEAVAYGFEMVARWAMLKGPVFKDGDTCGTSQTERIRIHHQDLGQVVKGPVLVCTIEHLDRPTESLIA